MTDTNPWTAELFQRSEAKQVRCPRCGAGEGHDCETGRYPPGSKGAQTYHSARLLRVREGW